jgi:hypothetical protein
MEMLAIQRKDNGQAIRRHGGQKKSLTSRELVKRCRPSHGEGMAYQDMPTPLQH